jgi:hypothetical protein
LLPFTRGVFSSKWCALMMIRGSFKIDSSMVPIMVSPR